MVICFSTNQYYLLILLSLIIIIFINSNRAIRMRKDFCYVFSSELNVPLRIRLVSLSGYLPNNGNLQRFATPSGCMFVRLTVCNRSILNKLNKNFN
jgi:hypothetical protein